MTTIQTESETDCAELICESEHTNSRSPARARLAAGLFVATMFVLGACLAMPGRAHHAATVSPRPVVTSRTVQLSLTGDSGDTEDGVDPDTMRPCLTRRLSVADAKLRGMEDPGEVNVDPCFVASSDKQQSETDFREESEAEDALKKKGLRGPMNASKATSINTTSAMNVSTTTPANSTTTSTRGPMNASTTTSINTIATMTASNTTSTSNTTTATLRPMNATTTNMTVSNTTPTNCSGIFEDCSSTQCCSQPGLQCYAKQGDLALCMESCNPGPNPSDVDGTKWSCEEWGSRSAGEPLQCAEASENCMDSKCCNDAGMACFAKNETFGGCRVACTPGPQYTDEDWKPWTCEQLGLATPSKAEWVEEECSGDLDDCLDVQCCKTSGFQCYGKNFEFAQCKAMCSTEVDLSRGFDVPWECKEFGSRTPMIASKDGGKVSPWVLDRCSKEWVEDCSESRCCLGAGMMCYEMDEQWAVCKETCEVGPDENNQTWSCKELGPRNSGIALNDFPTLLCFAVLRVDGYELDLMRHQYSKGAGVFACSEFLFFADWPVEIGGVKAFDTPSVPVGLSLHGTAANTELFMRIWDRLLEDDRVWHNDWTVKVDPDAVIFPDRLRVHLAPHTGDSDYDGKLFVANCNEYPGDPLFPMMYGSVEVFSKEAMRAYAEGVGRCQAELEWQDWGEDLFLTRCMDLLGVGRILDFDLVGDDMCEDWGQQGAGNCSDPNRAGFHPFKDIVSWEGCWSIATNR